MIPRDTMHVGEKEYCWIWDFSYGNTVLVGAIIFGNENCRQDQIFPAERGDKARVKASGYLHWLL